MNFTLITYRPNGVDSCRGCVMGQSDSYHDVKFFTEEDKLCEYWAKQMLKDSDEEVYAESEFTLLLDGYTDESDPDEDGSHYDLSVKLNQQVTALWESMLKQKLDQKAQEIAAKELKEKRDKEKAEKAQLAFLQEKYGIRRDLMSDVEEIVRQQLE